MERVFFSWQGFPSSHGLRAKSGIDELMDELMDTPETACLLD